MNLSGDLIGLLLAAGASHRFGSDKLICPLSNGEWVAVSACRNLLAGTERVLAVVRPGREALAERLRAESADVVICPAADRGMGASLAFGILQTPEAGGWLIALADMPWIKAETILAVAAAIRNGAPLAAPYFQGQLGHPVGFSSAYREELAGLSGESGAKRVIQGNLDRLCLVYCDDPGILEDIDEPSDLAFRS